ncbi:MAG: M24 family metallopeptidase [Bacteroidota bacterium]
MNRRKFITTTAAGTAGAVAATTLLSTALNAQESGKPAPKQDPAKIEAMKARIKPITDDERSERMERARKLMTENNLDAMLMEGSTNLQYYTGVGWGRSERVFAMLLGRTGEPHWIVPKFEEGRADEQIKKGKVWTWEEYESPYEHIAQALGELGASTGALGIEETTRYFVTEGIVKTLGSLRLASATPVTAGCRSVKTEHELELMQIANDITKEVFSFSLGFLKDGMKEREFGSVISKLYSEYGVSGGALVLFGEASAYPHGMIQDHALHDGQIVLIDGGCTVGGYESDVTRTNVFGKPTDKMNKVWDIVKQAQTAARDTAKPGVPSEDVDAAARKVIGDAGYGPGYKYFSHRLGHGIGMDGHEWYYLVKGNTRPLASNNTFSDEPGIYIPGEFGIRLEDDLQITNDGSRLMLPQAKSLEEIF